MISSNFKVSFIEFWKLKPPWCQPWSLVLTGFIVVFFSWVILEKIFFTLLVSLIIIIWWILFLIIAPLTYANTSSLSNDLDT